MPYKDPEKRKAQGRRYREAHPYLDSRTYADRKGYLQKYQRKYRWRVMDMPVPARPEPEWCECCGSLLVKTPHLDHDHNTGKFRGWICSKCNHALGLLGDTIAGVEKALMYLRRAE